ncbi:MAG: glycosyltransferase family 1 protein [Chloroflexi bacterium]|nr:glycosyltransferase family 1 protein [Chloroflexota bacterium]MCY3581035.1 glycosyltransferase family 1 protein [Chloroflexota bacterium]MCY3715224.1 glycosyltransferase family 1 protein [Chloroflexota bacterium]MDE2649995.1 glycosyltransferase family 1 protein [Chloroflexota bacterium]MXV92562.1 glycosyltransferase family 4 protein [Chloroflexota bacterium]
MSLRIAIDASRATAAQPTGTETYALRLIQTLIQANKNLAQPFQLRLYFRDRPAAGLFDHCNYVEQVVIRLPRLWTHLGLAAALWRRHHDILFVPAHTLPFVFPGRAMVTTHDLGYKYFPGAHTTWQRFYLNMTTRYSQARADIVLADSQATANDLTRFYGTSRHNIRIIYPGVDAAPLSTSPAHIQAARRKYRLPQRYFLFLGTLQPRKNISRLVQAFSHWQATTADKETALVLAGGRGWLFDKNWLRGASNLLSTGYIEGEDKAALLAGALAMVFPSLHEGFGFPVLEAMHCGTPVIASSSSSLPELVGDCGILVDPLDTRAIAAAMRRISEDAELRSELGAQGQKRAQRFNWESAAAQVLDAFAELGGSR